MIKQLAILLLANAAFFIFYALYCRRTDERLEGLVLAYVGVIDAFFLLVLAIGKIAPTI